jgi:hypothetical protein
MKWMFVVLMLGGGTALVVKLRYEAARERTRVVARLNEEAAALEHLTPTERLFQAEGVPIPRDPATTPPPASAGEVAEQPAASVPQSSPAQGPSDLAELFEGVELPCELAPVSMTGAPGVNCTVAVFATSRDHRPVLSSALGDEFTRIGCAVTWIDNCTAQVRRGTHSAVVSIYDHPGDHTHSDGSPMFPTVGPTQLVVKLTAV